jgi:hypothetical protein
MPHGDDNAQNVYNEYTSHATREQRSPLLYSCERELEGVWVLLIYVDMAESFGSLAKHIISGRLNAQDEVSDVHGADYAGAGVCAAGTAVSTPTAGMGVGR